MPDTHSIPVPATVTPPGGMPVEIAKAIGAVMAQVKALPKGERNQHANYNFASIDDFLSFVGPLCSTAGLIVIQDEEAMEAMNRGDKTWLKATYTFTLAHVSGAVWDRPTRRTVFQRIDGPQTTGGTQSYALKMFLRSLFQIPTGDRDDADYQAKVDMPAADSPQARQKPAQRAQPRPSTDSPQAPGLTRGAPSGPGEPSLMQIPLAQDGSLLVGKWVSAAKGILEGKPEAWRREWLALHEFEVDEVRKTRREWADKLEALAIAPDLAPLPAAQ